MNRNRLALMRAIHKLSSREAPAQTDDGQGDVEGLRKRSYLVLFGIGGSIACTFVAMQLFTTTI